MIAPWYKHCPGIWLEGMRRKGKGLSERGRCPGRNTKRPSSEHKWQALPFESSCFFSGHSNLINKKRPTTDRDEGYPITVLSKPLGLQEVESSRICRKSGHESSKRFSRTHRPPLPPTEDCWYLFMLETRVHPRAIVRPELLNQWKILMSTSGIEPATYQFTDRDQKR